VRTNRKTLVPNQKQLSAEVRRRAVISEVGATGIEPRVAVYLLPYPTSVGSTDASVGTCGDATIAASSPIASPFDAGWFGLAGWPLYSGCEAPP
jgi:hypothetical protein